MRTYCYNLEDAEFVNSGGEKIPRCVPDLSYQEHAVWKIFLRDRSNAAYDLSGVVTWSAAVDCDFRSGSAPMCRTLPAGISADAETGGVTVTLDASTSEFLAAVNGVAAKPAFFELCGFDAEGRRAVYLAFEIRARMTLDPDPEVTGTTPETLATKAFVSSLVVVSATAAAETAVSGALVDYPTSSGAALIASGAAATVVSGALVDYPTSSGAARIASGAAATAVSSAAKAADTLPAAASAYADQVYIYTGSTTSNFRHGRLYVCRSDGGGHAWRDVQTGLYPVGNVTGIRCYVLGTTVTVKWSDPADLVVDGVTLAAWGKTVLVRKQGGYPTGPDDGATVCVNTVRDAYKTAGFTETIPSGETYYYRWFIYTDDGVLNADPANEAVTGELTWATIREMCADADIDMRDVFSPGDVLTAANSVYPTGGSGNFEWQVTDVTEHDFGLCAYKLYRGFTIDVAQKAYALTPDTVFATWKLLSFSGYTTTNGDYFLKDETATGTDRVWRRRSGTMEVRYSGGAWVVFNTDSETVAATQTTSANDPWDGVWSNGITVVKAKKYYTTDGTTYTEATVTDGDAVTADTYYEANPGGAGRISHGSNDYENSPLDQLLNSDGDAGTFLVLPTIWSNPPDWAATQAGFKKGFDPDFLAAVRDTEIVVDLNKVCAGGGQKTLTRKFYLLSQTEIGLGGSEGRVLALFDGAGNSGRIKYKSDGSASTWSLRSPNVGYSYSTGVVGQNGVMAYASADFGWFVVPACRIGVNE